MKQRINSTLKSGLQAAFLYLVLLSLPVACQKDADGIFPEDRPAQELTIATHVTGFMPEDSVANTRASISGNTFSFTSGDAIGLIGLKNGSVMSEYNNIKLIYSSGGRWKSNSPLYDFGATSYIAYYPYSSNMSGKTSIDAIKNAFTIQNDQSSEANFNASNLLTATASASGISLQLSFTPAFAMVEVNLPEKIQGYSNGGGEKYTYDIYGINVSSPSFNTPFYKVDNRTYRRIIKPSTSTEIKVSYNINSKKTLSYTKQMNVSGGNYKKMIVGNVNQNILKGDYAYRQNGRLAFLLRGVSNDNKNDCFGVVCICNSDNKLIVAKNDAGNYDFSTARDGTASSDYSKNNPVPTGGGGWFLPSKGLFQLYNSNQVDTQLAALGDKSYAITKNGSGKSREYHHSDTYMTQFGATAVKNDNFETTHIWGPDGCNVRFFCFFGGSY